MEGLEKIKVFIVNGKPNCGKTTFEQIVKDKLNAISYNCEYFSIIQPVCNILKAYGFDTNSKDEKMRKLKAKMKDALDEYNNYSYNICVETLQDYYKQYGDNKDMVVFWDMRSDYDIEKAKNDFNALSVYINKDVPVVKTNHADAEVDNIIYDIVVDNNGSLEDLSISVDTFINNFILIKE